MLRQETEMLARLMATENIDVYQRNVDTAYFNVKTRELVLPTWKDLSECETEMLVGHEIGHALYTPADKWEHASDSFNGSIAVFKFIVNVIEDTRIERGVKKKYPGMRRVFYQGYNELWNRGVFNEVAKSNVLTLVDKLNLEFKVPGKVLFEKDETFNKYYNKISECVTFDDVVALTHEVYEVCKQEFDKAELEAEKDDQNQGESEQQKQVDGQQNPDSGNESPENENQSKSNKNQSSIQKDDSNDSNDSNKHNNNESKFEEQYNSKTQKAMDEFLSKQVDTTYFSHYDLPVPNMSRILVRYKRVLEEVKNVERVNVKRINDMDDILEDELGANISVKRLMAKQRPSVDSYIKTFEMKKKAKEYAKTQKFKVGKLDMTALAKYKFTEDLFLTSEVKFHGKKHGIVFYVDLSSSMKDFMKYTIQQLIEIMTFCRRAGIPVSVYGFTDDTYAIRTACPPTRDIRDLEQFECKNKSPRFARFALLEIFSHKMSNKEYNYMVEAMVTGKYKNSALFTLGSTPLVPALNTLEAVTNTFRKETASQIVNVVFLTDGGDNGGGELHGMVQNGVLYDRFSKHTVKTSDFINEVIHNNNGECINGYSAATAAMLCMMKKKLKNVNVVNFFISNNNNSAYYTQKDTKKMGFDEYYIVSINAFVGSESLKFKEGVTDMENITNTFAKRSMRKKLKRTMIDSFIDKIA